MKKEQTLLGRVSDVVDVLVVCLVILAAIIVVGAGINAAIGHVGTPLLSRHATLANIEKLAAHIHDARQELRDEQRTLEQWRDQIKEALDLHDGKSVSMYFAPGDYGILTIDKDFYEDAMMKEYRPKRDGFWSGNIIMKDPNGPEWLEECEAAKRATRE
jgi:hypothetical protein